MRQYAGFGSAEETNRRFRYLLAQRPDGPLGGLRPADPDGLRQRRPDGGRRGGPGRRADRHDRRHGALLDGIDLGAVSTSMTINATAAILLGLYEAVGRRQGIDADAAARHDPERHPQGVHRARDLHLPARALDAAGDRHLRLLPRRAAAPGTRSASAATTCARRARPPSRRWPSPSPMRSPTADAAIAAGLAFDEFAPRLSFFFAAHNDLFEEVAKFRAARRRLGAGRPRSVRRDRTRASMAMRFHVQTGGSTLTAQQPETNVVRTTVQALAAVLGGAQSLHTNALDEALGLPSPATARLALRTQQVLAYESGVTAPVDPLGRLVLRRVADRCARRAGHRRAGRDRPPRRDAGRPGRRLPAGRDRRGGVRRSSGRSRRGSGSWWASTPSPRTATSSGPQPQVIDPEAEARAGGAHARGARRPRPGRVAEPPGRARPAPRSGRRTCCRASGPASRRRSRWARSATRCAASGGSTGHDHRRHRPRRRGRALHRRGAAALRAPLRLAAAERAPFVFPQQGVRLCFLPTGDGAATRSRAGGADRRRERRGPLPGDARRGAAPRLPGERRPAGRPRRPWPRRRRSSSTASPGRARTARWPSSTRAP